MNAEQKSVTENPVAKEAEVKPKRRSTKAGREALKDWLQIAAFLIAGGWAAFTFYHAKIYEPKQIPNTLTFRNELNKVSDDGQYEVYKLTVFINNTTPISEKVIAAWFKASAFKLLKGNQPYQDTIAQYKYYEEGPDSLIAMNPLLSEQTSLYPNQVRQIEKILVVPKNNFDIIRISCYAITSKNDGLKIDWKIKGSKIDFNMTDSTKKIDTLHYDDVFNFKLKTPADFASYGISKNRSTSVFSITPSSK